MVPGLAKHSLTEETSGEMSEHPTHRRVPKPSWLFEYFLYLWYLIESIACFVGYDVASGKSEMI